ncbi:MAG: hypothetical protein AB8H79_00855 [Myxococcota bacterium]
MNRVQAALLSWAVGSASAGCTRVLELPETSGSGDGLCLPAQADGFRMPSVRWALAASHASWRLDDDAEDGIALSPNFFLATAWQTTAFSCADYGAPWKQDGPAGTGGCLDIQRQTTWTELTVLFPSIYPDGNAYDQAFEGDQPESSTMALAWSTVGAHALWGRPAVDQVPAEFYARSTDPRPAASMSAMIHAAGPWSGAIPDAIQRCPNDVAACADGQVAFHIRGVLDKMDALDAASCFQDEITQQDLDAHVKGLRPWWPEENWDRALAAARAALADHEGEGFERQVVPVLNALDSETNTRLRCPEETLWSVYRYSCP